MVSSCSYILAAFHVLVLVMGTMTDWEEVGAGRWEVLGDGGTHLNRSVETTVAWSIPSLTS